MRHSYARLTDRDRFYIKTRLDAGDSMRSIAAALRRSPSTVAREVRRNAAPQGYCALAADQVAAAPHDAGHCGDGERHVAHQVESGADNRLHAEHPAHAGTLPSHHLRTRPPQLAGRRSAVRLPAPRRSMAQEPLGVPVQGAHPQLRGR